jgi:hypothetical protein
MEVAEVTPASLRDAREFPISRKDVTGMVRRHVFLNGSPFSVVPMAVSDEFWSGVGFIITSRRCPKAVHRFQP